MPSLYIDQSGLELREEAKSVRIYKDGEFQQCLPIKLIDRFVIQGNVTLSTSLIGQILANGSTMVLLSRRNSDRVATIVGKPHNDARIRLAQYELVTDDAQTNRLARMIVRLKIRKQLHFLCKAMEQRLDQRKPLTDATAQLRQALSSLSTRAAQIFNTDQIRGVEGAAARAYFQGYIALFPASAGFTGRNRRPPRDPVNAALSLGYTLLHHEAVAAAYGAGFDPYLGCYHRPSFGRESLACDLVELLRADVDEWVWELFRTRALRVEHFNLDKGACLLGKNGRSIYFSEWERFMVVRRKLQRRWLQRMAARLKTRVNELEADEERDWE